MPVMVATTETRGGIKAAIFALRTRVSEGIRAALPGRAGGFAAAILTGDRSYLDPVAVQDLRDSNLAHLLAISGLHMGLMTGIVFGVVGREFVCVEDISSLPFVLITTTSSRRIKERASFGALARWNVSKLLNRGRTKADAFIFVSD